MIKFIRRGGRIIPIRDKGEKKGKPSEKVNRAIIEVKTSKVGAGERVFGGAKFGAKIGSGLGALGGAVSAGLSPSIFRHSSRLSSGKIGGALSIAAGAAVGAIGGAVNFGILGGALNGLFGSRNKTEVRIGQIKKLKKKGNK